MHKKLAVALAAVAALGGLIMPAASTKADVDPVLDALTSLPRQQEYQVVPMRITAYSSSPDETDYDPEYTASGKHVADGIVASNLFPFGTKIMIPSLFGSRVFTVEDRMAKRFQKTIDIWMTNKQKALVFGVSYTKVLVLGTTTLASFNPPSKKQLVMDKNISMNLR